VEEISVETYKWITDPFHVIRTKITTFVSWRRKLYWNYTRESTSKKLSAILFFQFIYTKVGVEQVRHFST
jgi:hypothetical protein